MRALRWVLDKYGLTKEDVAICYEAGPTGFVLARRLRSLGFECEVAAPSLIPVKASDRIAIARELVAARAQDDFYTAAAATATVTAIKADQLITNFLPADGMHFVLGTATGLSAQASSGLAVGFVNLAPEFALLAGTNLTFTNTGQARVRAEQAGDANWNAAVPVTNFWPAGSQITNLTPDAANVGGGIAVRIQGRWLGDGTDITNVALAGWRRRS